MGFGCYPKPISTALANEQVAGGGKYF